MRRETLAVLPALLTDTSDSSPVLLDRFDELAELSRRKIDEIDNDDDDSFAESGSE
jgi:hypothetical protein